MTSNKDQEATNLHHMSPPAASDGITEVTCGKCKSKKTKSKLHCGEDAGKLSFRNMWVNGLESYRSLVAWLKEQAARARDKALRVSNGKLLLKSTLWPHEAAQKTHNTASGFVTTGDVAGALRHVPACVSTFKHVTITAHMPAPHNNAIHMVPVDKQETPSSILCPDSSTACQHNLWTSHLRSCSTMQKTSTSQTGREVGTADPARRIAASATALV